MARFALGLPLVLVVISSVSAQTVPVQIDAGDATGVQPHVTYGGARENINLATGDLNFQIPLLHLPGRDGLDLSLSLIYDSKIWDIQGFYDQFNDEDDYNWNSLRSNFYPLYNSVGWTLSIPSMTSTFSDRAGFSGEVCFQNFVLTLSDGSKHNFRNAYAQCGSFNSNGVWVPAQQLDNWEVDSDDATYMHLHLSDDESDWIVYLKNGTRLRFTGQNIPGISGGTPLIGYPTRIEDVNGNYIGISVSGSTVTITDTVKRTVSITQSGGANKYLISYTDSSGTAQTVTLNLADLTLSPTFTNPPNPNPPGNWNPAPRTAKMPTSVVLPTGRSFTFTHNTYGELTKVTYPEGGYTTYDYAPFPAKHHFPNHPSIPDATVDFREVAARHVCQDYTGTCTPTYNTTYAPTVNSTVVNNQYESVTDPLGNLTKYQFNASESTSYFGNSPRELSRWIYQGSTTLLRKVDTTYSDLDTNGNPTQASLPLTKTTTLYDVSPSQINKVTWAYDTFGGGTIDNVTNKNEYDYPSGTLLIRQTVNGWLKTNSVNGIDYTQLPYHILDRKLSETIEDATNTPMAKTQFEYDNYSTAISASGAVQHDSAFGTAFKIRANVTKSQRWRNTDNSWLATTKTYDDAGNALKITDPIGNTTTLGYADSWNNATCLPSGGNAAAYVTKATNALTQVVAYKYNSCTGTMFSLTDLNSQTTTFGYDSRSRLTQTTYPDGGLITYCFSDDSASSCFANGQLYMTRTDKITASINKTQQVWVDGVGNVTRSRLTSDPDASDGNDTVDITYDGLERKSSITNPYRSSGSTSTNGITGYVYDFLNRVRQVNQPDGSTVQTSYAGNQTTVTDEAGKQRKSQTDALGRLTKVWEDPATNGYETDYTYNVLGDLLRVDQIGGDTNNERTRTFIYDSLSRLTSATNPESGTITYAYANGSALCAGDVGAVCSKLAPAPNVASGTITTTYTYDILNRLTRKSYSDSTIPEVWAYDQASVTMGSTPLTISNGKGRLTSSGRITSSPAHTYNLRAFSYDAMGRIVNSWESQDSGSFIQPFVYTYNSDGSLQTLSYPSGRVLTYTVGGAGRMTDLNDLTNHTDYVQQAAYAPPGELTGMVNAYTMLYPSGIMTTNQYNNRLQPAVLSVSSAHATLFNRSYNFHLGSGDNGNVYQIVNSLDDNRTQNFIYDNLNRITQAYTTGPDWGEAFTIDAWGNLTNRGPVSGKTNYEPLNAVATTKNQLAGFGYDGAGNLTTNGSATYSYDAENRLLSTGGWTNAYDADGRRVIKSSGSAGMIYNTGAGNEVLLETDLAGNALSEYIYFNGKRLARRDANGGVFYYYSDHLGSASVIVNSGGTTAQESDYYPYGGEIVVSGSDPNRYKFTGKERDTESGLDEFGARYYASSLGRFMIPDWAEKPTNVPYASFGNPQSLNLYSYVNNNPTTTRDPDGHVAGADDLVEGAVIGLTITVMATQAYYAMPAEQRNFGAALSGAASSVGSTIRSWFQSSDNSKTAPTTPAPATTPTSGQQVPTQAPGFVGDAGGNVVPIPAGSTARPADNGNGVVYQPPVPAGAHPDANAVRVMGPTTAQPTGSITVHGPTGQPINPATGKPDTRANTHTPIVPVAPKPCASGGSGCSK